MRPPRKPRALSGGGGWGRKWKKPFRPKKKKMLPRMTRATVGSLFDAMLMGMTSVRVRDSPRLPSRLDSNFAILCCYESNNRSGPQPGRDLRARRRARELHGGGRGARAAEVVGEPGRRTARGEPRRAVAA